MTLRRLRAAVGLAAVVPLLAVLAAGCTKKLTVPLVPEERPSIRLTAAPVAAYDTTATDTSKIFYAYHYRLNWVGNDPDGRVDHYDYAIDPPNPTTANPNPDTAWVRTNLNEKEIFFKAGTVDDPVNRKNPHANDFHVFVIRAVDNSGLYSAPAVRAFFSDTQAPLIQIDSPQPSTVLQQLVTPFLFVQWHGQDPDGVFTQKPVKYKYKLFSQGNNEFDYNTLRTSPDSLRHYYAPNFPGWDSTSADTTFATFTNLVPGQSYILVVVGFDEAGAYSPIFSRNTNMLEVYVTFAGVGGPVITMFNEFFNYTYSSGGVAVDPSRIVQLEVPGRRQIRFNWFAEASRGSTIKQYRWCMDSPNLDDETGRSDERTDVRHWSQWSLTNVSAVVGPFRTDPSDTTLIHNFYIEAEDINGLISLGIIQFAVILPTFNYDMLIVNDTRLLPDNLVPGTDSLDTPRGPWPNRAELDTFLFARGGTHWQFTPDGFPSTPPGIFAGYSYDTIYTQSTDNNGIVTLAQLGKYRHVLWLTDPLAANGYPPLGPGVLRSMSDPGHANTLAAYVSLGGRVWLAGSGVFATMFSWNNPTNDGFVKKYSSIPVPPRPAELLPGRFPFDYPHWQSEIWAAGIISNNHVTPRTVGGWPARSDPALNPPEILSPDYSKLPPAIGSKARFGPNAEQLFPYRGIGEQFPSQPIWDIEAMPGPAFNIIQEDSDPDPDSVKMVSTLDTLYSTAGIPIFPSENYNLDVPSTFYLNVCMTYYHGYENPPFVMTGFDLWHYAKPQVTKLVDFVFQDIWGIQKSPQPLAAPNGVAVARGRPLRPVAPAPTLLGQRPAQRTAPRGAQRAGR